MRAEDTDTRVRLVPLDVGGEPDGPQLDDAGSASRRTYTRGRVVGALIVLVSALALVGGFVTLGDRSPTSERDVDFATETHLGDAADLMLAARADSAGWSITWTPLPSSDATGAVGAIPTPVVPRAEFPTMDAGEAWLASESCVGTDCRLALTPVDDRTAVVAAVTALDYVWHATDAGQLAWIERTDASTVLRTGSIDRELGLIVDPAEVEVLEATKVQLWDEAGFILGGERAYAVGVDGSRTWTAEGLLLDAAPTVVTLQTPNGGWSILDRANGSPIMESSPSDGVVMVARERVGAPASSVAGDGYRYTFSLVPLPEDDPENLRSDLIRLPIGSDVGSEYRLLRNSIGDRFTFSLVRPSPEP